MTIDDILERDQQLCGVVFGKLARFTMHLDLNIDKERVLLIKLMGAKLDNCLVVATGIEHEHVSASDLDEALGDARPYLGIPAKMLFDGLDRALNVIL